MQILGADFPRIPASIDFTYIKLPIRYEIPERKIL
jgi:hypothetical protein